MESSPISPPVLVILVGPEHEQLRGDASFTDSARNLDTASEPTGAARERLERVDPERIRSESQALGRPYYSWCSRQSVVA
jgi:hypothetical protein